jgi:CRISPR-associated exonuclease Cas4
LSEEDTSLIPVTLIKEYHVCPRIVYFREVAHAPERTTESMQEGKKKHEKISELENRRTTLLAERKQQVKRRWDSIYASSEKIGIFGVIDCVVQTETGYHLIEHKSGTVPRKPRPNHIYQAAAYAMLAEESLGITIRDIIIDYSSAKKSFAIPLTDEIRKHVLWTVSQIRKIIEKEILPAFKLKRYCNVCGYRCICMGV